MSSRLGKVKVFDNSIDHLFALGQDAADFTVKTTREILYLAANTTPGKGTPSRSGHLSDSHYKNYLHNGRFIGRGYVGNSASYAAAVHEGVPGPIFPHGEFLLIPKSIAYKPKRSGGTQIMKVSSVRGQVPKPWIRRAARIVLAKHGMRVP